VGLVTLNRTIGDRTGWFGFGYNNNAFFTNAKFDTAGYPAADGYNGQQMYLSEGRMTGTWSSAGLAFYQGNITIHGGQSGSPFWENSPNGSPIIYGVIAGSQGQSPSSIAFASRITQSVFYDLQNWRNSDRAPSSASVTTASFSPTATASTTTTLLGGFLAL